MIFDIIIVLQVSDLAKKSEFKKVNFCVGSINFGEQYPDVNWPLPFHNDSFWNNKKMTFFFNIAFEIFKDEECVLDI